MEIEKQASKFTVRNYAHYLNRFNDWYQKNSNGNIKTLDLNIVKKYRVYLSRYTDQKGSTLSRVTQSYHVIALRSLLKWLTKNDWQVLSPEKIDLPKTESRSLKFLNSEQIERLLSSPSISTPAGLRDKAILELLFSTGLRVSELVSLNKDKLDFNRREFGVIGKGGRARVVFMSKRAASWVKRYLEARQDKWIPVFVRHGRGKEDLHGKGEGMRFTTRGVQRVVEKYTKKAKLPIKITPHGMRHTFATDMLSQGAGLREVQEMLGHKNISTTQIYTHVTNPQLKKVHEKYHSGNKGSS
jgi:site-specific recombinase XerD